MAHLTADIAGKLVEACQAGAEQAAEALGRAFAGKFSVSVGEASAYAAESPPAGFDGPGLIVLLIAGDVGMMAALPQACGLLPGWCIDPSPAEDGRLQTLARELASILAPADLAFTETAAVWTASLSAGLARAEVAAGAPLVPLEIKSAERSGQLSILWPLAAPNAIKPKRSRQASGSPPGDASAASPTAKELDFSRLPHYARSLLRIRVPISVQLATRKEAVQEVIGLAPGSIIKFDKNCDELLQMVVGEQPVAEGEAVKVGDKFGFRVSSMLLPREHFLPVKRSPGAAGRAAS